MFDIPLQLPPEGFDQRITKLSRKERRIVQLKVDKWKDSLVKTVVVANTPADPDPQCETYRK